MIRKVCLYQVKILLKWNFHRQLFCTASSVHHHDAAIATPLIHYEGLIRSNIIKFDERQMNVVTILHKLHENLILYHNQITATHENKKTPSWFDVIFQKTSSIFVANYHDSEKQPQNIPQSVYLWGGTGSGKTFLMDLFYESIPFQKKRRIHFNNFMIDLHKRLHLYAREKRSNQQNTNKTTMNNISVLDKLCIELSEEFIVICFDEFQITDVADAMILKNLFTKLHHVGVVIICTSNRPPHDLYLNGLQRDLFLPFIQFVNANFLVHDMDSVIDYRKITASLPLNGFKAFYSPINDETFQDFRSAFKSLAPPDAEEFAFDSEIYNRIVTSRHTLLSKRGDKMALFYFEELCSNYLGPADFIKIAETFRVVFISDIPVFNLTLRSELRRFITLIDCLYEKNVLVVMQAEKQPFQLLSLTEQEKKNCVHDEIFAFDRCISRMIEMQSQRYIESAIMP